MVLFALSLKAVALASQQTSTHKNLGHTTIPALHNLHRHLDTLAAVRSILDCVLFIPHKGWIVRDEIINTTQVGGSD